MKYLERTKKPKKKKIYMITLCQMREGLGI